MKNSQCPSPITVIYSFARVDQHEIWTEQFWVVSSVSSIDQSEKFIFTKFPCRQNCQLPLHRGGVTLGAGNCGDVGREGRSFTYNVRVRYCLDKYQMSLIKKNSWEIDISMLNMFLKMSGIFHLPLVWSAGIRWRILLLFLKLTHLNWEDICSIVTKIYRFFNNNLIHVAL